MQAQFRLRCWQIAERLIRHARTFDLIGLPPTPAEVDADFVGDPSPDAVAFAKVVDRLLASPHYMASGWGRYWPSMWPAMRRQQRRRRTIKKDREFHYGYLYRDWVILAASQRRFALRSILLSSKIAADQLPHTDNLDLPALGLLTIGRRFISNRQLVIDDQIDVVCRGTMGLTVTCARCHNHKFDPIPTADYYSLYGVMDSFWTRSKFRCAPELGRKSALIDEDRPQPAARIF